MDKERICDHMARLSHFTGRDNATTLLGTLVHWVISNNLCTITNKYPMLMASSDFKVSYTQLKRIVSGTKQKGGSEYKRHEKSSDEENNDRPPPKKQ